MIRSMKCAIAACAGLAIAFATPAAAADALPCADYVSTAINDEPDMGQLIGTESRTETMVYTINANPGGIGSSTTYTKTVTYEVGLYQMADGELEELDCRDYTQAS